MGWWVSQPGMKAVEYGSRKQAERVAKSLKGGKVTGGRVDFNGRSDGGKSLWQRLVG